MDFASVSNYFLILLLLWETVNVVDKFLHPIRIPKKQLAQSIYAICPSLCIFNPFVPNAPFLYHMKTSENFTVFWSFQEVEKGCIRN